jgi:hypothetical protein
LTAQPVLYADYNGALRARKFCEDATAAVHFMDSSSSTIAAGVFTGFVKIKAGERTSATMYLVDSVGIVSGTVSSFNLTTGVVTTGTQASIVSVGGGYFQCAIYGTFAAGAGARVRVLLSNGSAYTGDGSSGIYIADAQLNDGSSALAYYDTTQYPYNAPRFDYDPVTLVAKGLLIEEQRTNLLLQSNDFQTSWSPTNITRTLNSTLSPSGNVDGVKIAATAAAVTELFQDQAVASTSVTASIYVKQGTSATAANAFGIRNVTTATNLIIGTFNYSTGVFTYTVGSTGVTVTNAGNGYWRIQFTATITSGNTIRFYVGFLGATPAAGDFVYAYGAQLEAGSAASSYIPTVGSQLTRAADQAIVYTLSPWFNAQAGTVYVQFDSFSPVTAVYSEALGIATYPATQDGFVSMGIDNAADASTFGGTYLGSATFQSSFSNTNGTWYTPNKIANSYKLNDFAFSSNGAATQVDTSGTVPPLSSTHAMTIGSLGNSRYLNGHIQRITYYPRRLTDTEFQTLTTL